MTFEQYSKEQCYAETIGCEHLASRAFAAYDVIDGVKVSKSVYYVSYKTAYTQKQELNYGCVRMAADKMHCNGEQTFIREYDHKRYKIYEKVVKCFDSNE